MIFFITKFVICVTKFVIRVTKFVIYVSKFVTNFFWRIVKTIKGLGKNSSGLVKYFCLAVQGRGGRPDGDALIKTVHYI